MTMRTEALTVLLAALIGWSVAPQTAMAQAGDARVHEVGDTGDQLATDLTRIPAGMGAVLVPSLSRPELEPAVRLFKGDQVAGRGTTARRILVAPGRYRVVVGQGPTEWRASRDVEVIAGETTVADGFVGALRVSAISVVDGSTHNVTYALQSADGRRTYGPETTDKSGRYSGTRTWLLRPGTYRIVPGSDPEAIHGASAVVVPADGRVRVRFLIDRVGDVLGLEPADFEAERRDSDWKVDWVIGGSLSFGQSSGQLGSFSGMSTRVDAFTDFGVAFDKADHLANFGLAIEQSWLAIGADFGRGLPFQKLDDSIKAELGYTYRLARIFGPYVRATARTSLLPTQLFPEQETTVVTRSPSGEETESTAAAGSDIELMPMAAPLLLQEGVGIGVTAWDDRIFGFGVRGGIAMRQAFYQDGGRYVLSHSDGRVVLGTLKDNSDWGPEVGAWLRLRLGHWLSLRSDFDGFVPIAATTDSDEPFRPVFDFTSTVNLRLSSFASLVYRATLHRDDAAIVDLQFRQTLSLRFNYSIF